MLYNKQKLTVTISGGTGSVNTAGLKGFIELMTVTPTTSTNVWDMTIKDKDRDIIFNRQSETGTLFYIDGLPVGLDEFEKLNISFANVTINEVITVALRIREAT